MRSVSGSGYIRKVSAGFTLIELMVTIVIAAIFISLAVPSMRAIILNNRVAAHSNDFLSSLIVARSEAIKRNKQVRISVKSATPDVNNEWGKDGWRVWIDDNGDSVFGAAADTVIRQAAAVSNTFVIDAATNGVTEIIFYANGSSSQDDDFTVKITNDCPGTSNTSIKGKTINISATGRASSTSCSCDSSATDPC